MRRRLKKCDTTKTMSFSVHAAVVKRLRQSSGHFGSVGRAMQVAMELLCDRAEKGMPREISFLDEMQLEGIKNPAKNAFDLGLKVPFSFSVLPRTEKQIKWLSHPKRYGNQNEVISVCDNLLWHLALTDTIFGR